MIVNFDETFYVFILINIYSTNFLNIREVNIKFNKYHDESEYISLLFYFVYKIFTCLSLMQFLIIELANGIKLQTQIISRNKINLIN